ncbi:AraC family transcriptional regulator [Clostridium sp. C8-1-8]|uniref:AraC family transcriptional regulator n=1 Tax=Clostridium sp. C8-1-8 TaxID=2698831 RepID=UPI00136B85BD|nr:AraC family transcriptional regulator [Clostridium sp. C8-1-8]
MNGQSTTENIKRGYLNEDFLFFKLKDQKKSEYELHYHDFSKIIFFISGDVTYIIEGKSYKLRPWDILLVGKDDLHLPIISFNEPYERIILWINPLFLEKYNAPSTDLLNCFKVANERKLNLIRLNSVQLDTLKEQLSNLEKAVKDDGFGSEVLRKALFLQLIVEINRLYLEIDNYTKLEDIKYDPRIEEILNFINSNLGNDLSIELIANNFYLNKYYLMHLFKKETGYTLYGYIQKKRLRKAAELIKSGLQSSEVCSLCGFIDYSSFVRAFKKEFQFSPKQYFKASSSN